MTLARRFIQSGLWATGGNAVATALAIVRSIALARMLPIEVFGIYAFSGAVTGLTAVLAAYGLSDALIHRAEETRDAERAAATHFTLTLLFAVIWTVALLSFAFTFYDGQMLTALVVMTGTQAGMQLCGTPSSLLKREVNHRPLALLWMTSTALSTLIAIVLASTGQGLWALLAVDVVVTVMSLVILFRWGPRWRPRLLWDRPAVRYFLRFGSRNVVGRLIEEALQRIDKLWTGAVVGHQGLGLYSRASVYSRAPSQIVGRPLALVITGVYAELAGDRPRLSHAVARVTELLLHGSAALGVMVAVIAPDLIAWLIGEKWLGMVDTFRILIVASVPLLIARTLSQLLLAVGQPGKVMRVGFVRLLVLAASLVTMGYAFGIEGVAASVLTSSIVGLFLLMRCAADHVDLSAGRLLGPAFAAIAAGLLGAAVVAWSWPADASTWQRVLTQMLSSGGAYLVVLLMLRGRQLQADLNFILRHSRKQPGSPSSDGGAGDSSGS